MGGGRMNSRTTLARCLALAAMVTMATAACASAPPQTQIQDAPGPTTVDALAAFGGLESDYEPYASTDAMAKYATLIVLGTVERVQAGRTFYVPASPDLPGDDRIVLVLTDVHAQEGGAPVGPDEKIYVELAQPSSSDPAANEKAFPEGSTVVAYLVAAGEGGIDANIDVAIKNPAGGRPAGQPLFQPSGPQGLVLQTSDGDVVWPLTGATAEGEITDALPGGALISP